MFHRKWQGHLHEVTTVETELDSVETLPPAVDLCLNPLSLWVLMNHAVFNVVNGFAN